MKRQKRTAKEVLKCKNNQNKSNFIFLASSDAQLKQARYNPECNRMGKEFKAKLSGGHWNPFQESFGHFGVYPERSRRG